ncbi:hypothetical protein DRO69_08155 [Candidatus Bathyarchaeota archaeon]|nr:MAG: hypothetical protein DRO69_08155 [Candidatus Bathyarchaeota archaeon]
MTNGTNDKFSSYSVYNLEKILVEITTDQLMTPSFITPLVHTYDTYAKFIKSICELTLKPIGEKVS